MATEKVCIIPLELSTTVTILDKLHNCLKVRNIRPVLRILMQKAVTV